jgi:predicted DNA-binding protein (MmcQ/YjbR family)
VGQAPRNALKARPAMPATDTVAPTRAPCGRPARRGMLGPMSRAFVNAHCARLPGAERSDPWGGGHDAWKVGGKLFAVVGSMDEGVSVKTDGIETAALLIELGRAVRAPYFHRSWVLVRWGSVPEDELADRLDTSYRLIRASLPKKVRDALG